MQPSDDDVLFGKWVRRRRRVLELTQKELARRVGCSTAMVRKIERDERHPSRRMAAAMGNTLGVPESEREAFIRFARGGWADDPPAARLSRLDMPWAEQARPNAPRSPTPDDRSRRWSGSAPGVTSLPRERAVLDARPRAGVAKSAARSGPVVVARDAELRRLTGALRGAAARRGGIVFVAGEAGQGKTTLLRAFAARAQVDHPNLLVATGTCNAYTGGGDPFLPFREMLEQLTGEVPQHAPLDPGDRGRFERLRRFGPRGYQLLLEVSPALVGALVPVARLQERLALSGVPSQVDGGTRAALRGAPEDVPASTARAALLTATTRFVAAVADEAPLLLLLDDLQWVDRNSAELLLHLARTATSRPVLVLGAFRPSEVAASGDGRRHALQGVLHEIQRVHGDVIIDLDSADGRPFLEAWLDTEPNRFDRRFREAMFHQTGGQPLFTIELLRAMQERGDLTHDEVGAWVASPTLEWDALPTRVAGALGERIGRLSQDEQAVLGVASVEGESFTAEVTALALGREAPEVMSVLGTKLDKTHRLVEPVEVRRGRAGLLSRYRFRHNLIQRYVYENLDEGVRTYLHESIARALETVFGADADPMALAYHYLRARAPGSAARHLRDAGDRARIGGALEEAIDDYRQALEYWPDPEPGTRAALLRNLGACHYDIGAWQDSLRDYRAALDIYQDAGDARAAGAVMVDLVSPLYMNGQWEAALQIVRRACATLSDGAETPELARAQALLSRLYMAGSKGTEARAWAERALATAERLHDEGVRVRVIDILGVLLNRLGPERREEGLGMLEQASRAAERNGFHMEACWAFHNHACALHALGRLEEAEHTWEELVALARKRSLLPLQAMGEYLLWWLTWRAGRWSQALAERQAVVKLTDGTGILDAPLHGAVTVLASSDIDLGMVPRARSLLGRHAATLERLTEPQFRAPYLRERLRIAIWIRDDAAAARYALAILDTARDSDGEDPHVLPTLSALAWFAKQPTAMDRERSDACLRALEGAERTYGSDQACAAAGEARGLLALAMADARAAARQLLGSAERWQAGGYPLDEARARLAASWALQDLGKDRQAAAQRDRARDLLSALSDQLPPGELVTSFRRVVAKWLSSPVTAHA